MKKNAKNFDDLPADVWQACPPGTLTAMAGRLNAAGRRAEAVRVLGAGGLGALLVAAAVVIASTMTGPSVTAKYGGISCQACRRHFADYHQHLTAGGNAPPSGVMTYEDGISIKNVERHLADCPVCRDKFAELYPHALSVEIRRRRFNSTPMATSSAYLPWLARVAGERR